MERVWESVAAQLDPSPEQRILAQLQQIALPEPDSTISQRVWEHSSRKIRDEQNSSRSINVLLMPARAAVVLLIAAMLVLVSVNALAAQALPGSALYPFKITAENLRWALTWSEANRAQLAIQLAEGRRREAAQLVLQGAAPSLVAQTVRDGLARLEYASSYLPREVILNEVEHFEDLTNGGGELYRVPTEQVINDFLTGIVPAPETPTPPSLQPTPSAPSASVTPSPLPTNTGAPTAPPPLTPPATPSVIRGVTVAPTKEPFSKTGMPIATLIPQATPTVVPNPTTILATKTLVPTLPIQIPTLVPPRPTNALVVPTIAVPNVVPTVADTLPPPTLPPRIPLPPTVAKLPPLPTVVPPPPAPTAAKPPSPPTVAPLPPLPTIAPPPLPTVAIPKPKPTKIVVPTIRPVPTVGL